MKTNFNIVPKILVILAILFMSVRISIAADETGVVAEFWPLDEKTPAAEKKSFRANRALLNKPAGSDKLQLSTLEIPERSTPALVRVRGVFIPPQSGGVNGG